MFARGNNLHILQALADQCKFRHDCSDCRRVERFRVKTLILYYHHDYAVGSNHIQRIYHPWLASPAALYVIMLDCWSTYLLAAPQCQNSHSKMQQHHQCNPRELMQQTNATTQCYIYHINSQPPCSLGRGPQVKNGRINK